MVDNADHIRHLLHLAQKVAGDNDGDLAKNRQIFDKFPNFLNAGRVKSIGRFIENQQARIAKQRHCDAKALFHAKGILFDLLVLLLIKAHSLEHICNFASRDFFQFGDNL